MKRKTLYYCEKCGCGYKTKTECEKCESFHVGIKKLKGVAFHPIAIAKQPYPDAIVLEMQDGKTVAYRFAEPIDIKQPECEQPDEKGEQE